MLLYELMLWKFKVRLFKQLKLLGPQFQKIGFARIIHLLFQLYKIYKNRGLPYIVESNCLIFVIWVWISWGKFYLQISFKVTSIFYIFFYSQNIKIK